MKQKRIMIMVMIIFAVVAISGCKKNVGTPEDNAVVEDDQAEEKKPEEARVIGFSCPDLQDPFYKVLKDSVKTGIEAQGDHILVQDPASDADLQAEQISEMIASGIDAVFYWPVDPKKTEPALEELENAGIPVINLGVKVTDDTKIKAFIAYDEYNAGALCAENLKGKKPEGGSVALIENSDNVSLNERMTGFEEKLANSGFEVTGRINAGKGTEAMAELFEGQKSLDAVMCADDTMALEAVEILDQLQKSDVSVYSVGGAPEIKKLIAEPAEKITGVGALSPINMGKAAVETVLAVLDGGDYEKEQYIDTFFIDRENVEIYGTDGWQ